MKVTKTLGRIVKPFVNFPRWMGLGQIRATAASIKKMFQDLRIHRPPVREETFEEAKQRLNLSEEDIQSRLKSCFWLSILYSFIALLLLIYTIYMISHG